MELGSTIGLKSKSVLVVAGKLAKFNTGVNISVEKLNHICNLDRVEIRTIFKHMSDLGLINVETIGGEYLYGHISLTKKGLSKLITLI